MNIEWWMLDGGICLIILFSAILGAAKGIGDTFLRLIGMGGGIALGFMYSDKVTAWLKTTPFNLSVYNKVFEVLRGAGITEETSDPSVSQIANGAGQQAASDQYQTALPKIISGAANDLADKAASAAAERLTSMIMGILGFVLIVLAVWLFVTILRFLIKQLRDKSVILGFADRVSGFVLGIVKGLVVACIAAMLLVPVTTMFAPDAVPSVLKALDETYVAGIIYDVNPLLYLIKALL